MTLRIGALALSQDDGASRDFPPRKSVSTALVQMDPTNLPSVRRGGELKRVKMHHRKVIALHLQGVGNSEIARLMRRTPAWVSQTLRQPAIRSILESAYQDYDQELKALTPKAIEAFRRNLDCGDANVEIRAAVEVMKVNGHYDKPQEAQATAEDIVEGLWERHLADGSKEIRKVTRRRVIAGAMPPSGDVE